MFRQALSAAPDGAACLVLSSDARRFLPVFVFHRVRVGRILSVSVSASCRCRGGPPRVRSGVRGGMLVPFPCFRFPHLQLNRICIGSDPVSWRTPSRALGGPQGVVGPDRCRGGPLACARGTAKGCWSRSSTRSQEVFEGCFGDVVMCSRFRHVFPE